MLLVALLAASLTGSDSLPTASAPAGQGRTAEGPAIVVHRQPSLPLVSLRLSILANDPPGYAGAGHLVQHLAYPALRDRVARVGGRAQMQRTTDAIVYTATGPAAELTYLAEALMQTLRVPSAPPDAMLRAERELRNERLAEWEAASSHARSLLRAQLFPSDLSAAGTDRSSTRLTAAALPAVWAEIYDPARVSVVAVGDVFLGDVQRAFARLPDRLQTRPLEIERDSIFLAPLAPPQATRAWLGVAYAADDLDPAAVTVTTRLLGNLVRQRVPSAQVEAEHWWTHHGQATVLVVAVPERDMAAARRALGAAVGALLEDVDFLRVTAAATAARREMLFYSRTPDRMAELVGLFVDREGDPDATERFYVALDRLDDRDIRRVLERLIERTPARVEIPPQALQPRR